ncbi:tetratricopeptide repeat protein [Elizabethkingia meningoseptica]|uniref:tetratricopeptide repeat protein n=1 Tax=Elizabethkingia meningoseptica TaxID=238 RepID=UPI00084156F3|nr:tetratricopeptide repeat protein [Elizabethkingia meningoseptica]EJK5327607.1 tetratricopeptide repeat protein [Elizabethkingia meningoseptica]MDE5429587.1 tetratricopeptide repeat protein [Elizabethkingia meningoseptica]MDE5467243.1 tetratricopeptide repeat protein [Elizabethkingia meningoseptica]MDE5473527.1 tetratricopeptide repeat protein [Elizabethkingia meningoseptica]MDE5476960.1 tetratricopeptide repeat protein [Elizabethkingia meningoseptica]
MSPKNILIYAGIFGAVTPVFAQQSAFFNNREEYRTSLSEKLYQNKIYKAAQYEFARQYFYQNPEGAKKEASLFYDNIIGVILNQNHSEEGLEAFTKEYPKSAYFALANGPLADYYIAKKDFPKALESLKKVNQYNLSKEENTQYILKLGYAKFMTGDTKGAIEALEEAYNNANEDGKNDVAYMLGHLQYAEGNTEKAFQYFDSIKNNPKYAKTIRPYYVQLYFNEKNYDKAIEEGKALLNENISKDYGVEVNKIIGESYFMKKDYASAYPYLKTYLNSKSVPSESDLYEIGFVAAQLKKHDEAVGYYNQLISSQSPLAQNAYYQLGNAYLETGRKREALSAFRSASQMNYDAKVQQLAYEQYAKLGYDIGNPFESNSQVLQNYITKYPNAGNLQEMKGLLVKSYLYSGNYKETLSAIKKLGNQSAETSKLEQEAAFLLGTEEFNKGNFTEAETLFEYSLKYNYNKEFNARAQYWMGQSQYQMGDYSSATETLQKLYNSGADFEEKQQLPYDLAYAYFKNKKFQDAQKYFKQYLQNPKAEFKNDAELRLADTHYANNELNDAIAIYDKNTDATDYTQFQKAMSLGFKGDSEAKIAALKKLIADYKNSEYADDAQYEIGVAYASDERYAEANDYFNQVIKSSQDKDLVANASIYRAQNYADLGQADKAIAEFKKLGETYKGTAYADKVVAAAKSVYLKNGDTAAYQSFATAVGVKISSSELDEINLSTAQKLYANKDYKGAISYYEKYLTQRPTGGKLYQAQYELGESYYQTKNTTKAVLILTEVANAQNDYQEDAQVRLAQLYIAQNNSSEAKKYLQNLVNSSNAGIKNYAITEMMKISVDADDFSQAEKYADQILANPKNAASVKEQAQIIKARSLMKRGNDSDAKKAYTALEKSANPEVAAEALYAKAYYQNKGKAFKSSNETIFKLSNNYASEEYWGAKSLVLMAKNYLALGDKYQASYTVDQIIANYKDFPDVVTEAKQVKSQIKK